MKILCALLLFPFGMAAFFGKITCTDSNATIRQPISPNRFHELAWVAFAPTNFNPATGKQPDEKSLLADLKLLRKAGFNGLITYGSDGALGKSLPVLAQKAGFDGIIMGIWNIGSHQELEQAKAAASNPIVLGYCMGNEGLGGTYSLEKLKQAISDLKTATSKPVATTEQLEDYADDSLLDLGDWVFPNVHPYWHGQLQADVAVAWTEEAFQDFRRRTAKPILFKEVGFPTAGDEPAGVSEALQEAYYLKLAATQVPFVTFEAFDQPWKDHEPVEPHWGIFRADRSPKMLAKRLLELARKP